MPAPDAPVSGPQTGPPPCRCADFELPQSRSKQFKAPSRAGPLLPPSFVQEHAGVGENRNSCEGCAKRRRPQGMSAWAGRALSGALEHLLRRDETAIIRKELMVTLSDTVIDTCFVPSSMRRLWYPDCPQSRLGYGPSTLSHCLEVQSFGLARLLWTSGYV